MTERHEHQRALTICGVVNALRADVKAGYVQSIVELIHEDALIYYLDMVAHLHEEGYKDAAAVMAGGTREGHLRQLCAKHGVITSSVTPNGTKPKRADQLNSELAAGAYSKTDQKNVTAWLDLRNKAAHAEYGSYTKEQVSLLIQSVRDFITRYPA